MGILLASEWTVKCLFILFGKRNRFTLRLEMDVAITVSSAKQLYAP